MKRPTTTITLMLALLGMSAALRAQTLHALIACDTEDEKIGASMNEDLGYMETLVDIIGTATGLKPKITFFTPERGFSKRRLKASEISDAIGSITSMPDDVVLFYYSGHGTRKYADPDPFPIMAMGSGQDYYLELSKVRDQIKKKNPKLTIVIGDMCNSLPTLKGTKGAQLPIDATRLTATAKQNFQTLFSGLTGDITICSSPKGQTSLALKEGGAFTLAFIAALSSMVEGRLYPVSWEKLMTETGHLEYRSVFRRPYFEINVQTMPWFGPPTANHVAADGLVQSLLAIASAKKGNLERVNMQEQVLNTVFESPHAKVEIVGFSGKTVLDRVPSVEYISRICTINGLVNLSVKEEKKSASGKYTYLKIHEIFMP